MTTPYIHRPQLYRFLDNIIDEPLEKTILDCGAGGNFPPLSLFYSYGFKTYGIDISDDQIEKANAFAKENNMELNIQYGDMTKIPFPDESFSFVYSTNSIYHLTKKDTGIAIKEMERVLKKGGFLYVDFLSIDDGDYGKGTPIDTVKFPGEFYQKEHGGEVIHSYYADNEPDKYFHASKILLTNKNLMTITDEEKIYRISFTEYTSQKIEF